MTPRKQREGELLLLCAASAGPVAEDWGRAWEARTGLRLRVATGASSGLARQILWGAPGDVFLSAHPRWTLLLREKGKVEREADVMGNELVLAARAGDGRAPARLADLAGPGDGRLAVSAEGVPAGDYARQALTRAGLWGGLLAAGRLVHGHDVRTTLGYLSSGAVAAAVVYDSDIHGAAGLRVVQRFGPADHDPIRYQLALLARPGVHPAARSCYEFLLGDEAAKIARAHGFEP